MRERERACMGLRGPLGHNRARAQLALWCAGGTFRVRSSNARRCSASGVSAQWTRRKSSSLFFCILAIKEKVSRRTRPRPAPPRPAPRPGSRPLQNMGIYNRFQHLGAPGSTSRPRVPARAQAPHRESVLCEKSRVARHAAIPRSGAARRRPGSCGVPMCHAGACDLPTKTPFSMLAHHGHRHIR